ncbi:hypothetical protein B296_00007964 [Ensete ventricosum]|uniref:Uncharacterized protein n=1 Tax=Ensete ventricosum TaxID=4639 RepID=A0A427A5L2_ENSVE|nr:hypothetical protein B296_00007964 [Ensete ventricosum]
MRACTSLSAPEIVFPILSPIATRHLVTSAEKIEEAAVLCTKRRKSPVLCYLKLYSSFRERRVRRRPRSPSRARGTLAKPKHHGDQVRGKGAITIAYQLTRKRKGEVRWGEGAMMIE